MSEKVIYGRKPIVKSPDDFEHLATEYFAQCQAREVKPTVTGLTLALGMRSRQTLHDYANKETHSDFHDVCRWANLVLDSFWEERLDGPSPAGAIFWLCNRGEDGAAKFKNTQYVNSSVDATHRVTGIEVEFVEAKSSNTGEA